MFEYLNIFSINFVQFAQYLNDAPNPCPPGTPPDQCVEFPITGGIMLLITAALGIGIKAFSKKNRH